MRVLVIPDIHLKTWIFDRAEKILKDGKADRAACLMDIPDDWNMEFQIERYKETFDRAIAFAVDYPDTLWCYGNHDVCYPWGRLETGYSPYAERMVMSKLEELENSLKSPAQINIIHRIDNVLFSHGGFTADFLKWLDEDLLFADIDDVIAAVNDASHDYLWNDESPLWFRPQYETKIKVEDTELVANKLRAYDELYYAQIITKLNGMRWNCLRRLLSPKRGIRQQYIYFCSLTDHSSKKKRLDK